MNLPEPEGRPVWEPVVIGVFLAALLIADGYEMLEVLGGRARIYDQARDWLEIGACAMLAWGLAVSLYRAARWAPGD